MKINMRIGRQGPLRKQDVKPVKRAGKPAPVKPVKKINRGNR